MTRIIQRFYTTVWLVCIIVFSLLATVLGVNERAKANTRLDSSHQAAEVVTTLMPTPAEYTNPSAIALLSAAPTPPSDAVQKNVLMVPYVYESPDICFGFLTPFGRKVVDFSAQEELVSLNMPHNYAWARVYDTLLIQDLIESDDHGIEIDIFRNPEPDELNPTKLASALSTTFATSSKDGYMFTTVSKNIGAVGKHNALFIMGAPYADNFSHRSVLVVFIWQDEALLRLTHLYEPMRSMTRKIFFDVVESIEINTCKKD